ncbi:Os07g0542232, partial [Oryza sativa Japonica Group]
MSSSTHNIRRRREPVGLDRQQHHRSAGIEGARPQLGPQGAARAGDPRAFAVPREQEPLPPLVHEAVEAAPALPRRQVRRALRHGVDVTEPRVGAHPLARGEQPRGVLHRVLHGGVEELGDRAVVARDVGAADVGAALEGAVLAGVVGGGEEVALVGELGVAFVVDEDGVLGAVAGRPRDRVPRDVGATAGAVGGAQVAAAEQEAVDGVRGGAEGAGGEEGGRGPRGGVRAEDEREVLEVGFVGAPCCERAAVAA